MDKSSKGKGQSGKLKRMRKEGSQEKVRHTRIFEIRKNGSGASIRRWQSRTVEACLVATGMHRRQILDDTLNLVDIMVQGAAWLYIDSKLASRDEEEEEEES